MDISSQRVNAEIWAKSAKVLIEATLCKHDYFRERLQLKQITLTKTALISFEFLFSSKYYFYNHDTFQ